jgi:hypothetical protein
MSWFSRFVRRALEPFAQPTAAAPERRAPLKITDAALAWARVKTPRAAVPNVFTLPLHPPSVAPGVAKMAMDDAITQTNAWANSFASWRSAPNIASSPRRSAQR